MDITADCAAPSDLPYIDDLQRKNAECLAFYPKAAFEREIDAKRIILAKVNNAPAGYLYHGALGVTCKIHQACIQYDLRGMLYGAELVRRLLEQCEAAKVSRVVLACASDIDANKFWRAMGFVCEAVRPGGIRRGRDINIWALLLQAELFAFHVDASTKQKSAAQWAGREISAPSQFIRGRQMRQYRALIDGEK